MKHTEREIMPYSSMPSPPNTNEPEIEEEIEETVVYSTERKNSWVWSFYHQKQTPNGIFTVCNVENDDGVKCNKQYKTKGSTGNLINHLLKHGITKDSPYPKVCKIIIVINLYFCILIFK